jgi:hypothetical protein
MVCAEAAPAAATKAAVAIINFAVSFFIVVSSFGFAAAFPICALLEQPAYQGPGARKALKTRTRDANFRYSLSDRFTVVNGKVHHRRTDRAHKSGASR